MNNLMHEGVSMPSFPAHSWISKENGLEFFPKGLRQD